MVFLDATKQANGRWQVARAEAARFALSRDEPQVVMGYDVTFSVPKSVSALYAVGTDRDRQAIDDAIEAAIATGMSYVEREGYGFAARVTRSTLTEWSRPPTGTTRTEPWSHSSMNTW